jgi:hypothetical protein
MLASVSHSIPLLLGRGCDSWESGGLAASVTTKWLETNNLSKKLVQVVQRLHVYMYVFLPQSREGM